MIFRTLAERMKVFCDAADLYPVISSEFCAGRDPLAVLRAVGAGGAKLFQLREKHRSDRELYDLARAAREIADEYGMLFILDDRADIALAAGADGVHLGQDDLPVAAAKQLAPELIVGSSTHNLEEALAAEQSGADYLNIGPIYPTRTKSVACGALGVAAIGRIAPQLHIPFTVMGGIKMRHIAELRAAGARRIAMVTEITQAPDVTAAVRRLRELFR
ncbi:Thiamine-phosphate synthase [bioreactor metagenome]|uniref:thiamine phosphate synthase n=1 Tax=bioreactor metagenome TaxID=1076179 RepID=A0A645HG56_9ZZZZ